MILVVLGLVCACLCILLFLGIGSDPVLGKPYAEAAAHLKKQYANVYVVQPGKAVTATVPADTAYVAILPNGNVFGVMDEQGETMVYDRIVAKY